MSRNKLIALISGAAVLVAACAILLLRWTSQPTSAEDYIETLKDHGYSCENHATGKTYYQQCGGAHIAYFPTWQAMQQHYGEWLNTLDDQLKYPHYGNMDTDGLIARDSSKWEVICTDPLCVVAAQQAGWADNRIIKFDWPKPRN